jgi:hypothetical protein
MCVPLVFKIKIISGLEKYINKKREKLKNKMD